MTIYFVCFEVAPTSRNSLAGSVAGALASCCVSSDDPEAAYRRAALHVRRHDWEITGVKTPPVQVTEAGFNDKKDGLDLYKSAREHGIAATFVAWARDGMSSFGPLKLRSSERLDWAAHLKASKTLQHRGRCLYDSSGSRCPEEAIDAHSIQKNGALSLISENGEVYAVSRNLGDLKRACGRVTYTRQGIGTVSLFRGFCAKHDTEIFLPIDRGPLIPIDQQILLYAYRSLCREFVAKENAILLLKSRAGYNNPHPATCEVLDRFLRGSQFGMENLQRHKALFDQSLRAGTYSDVRSVLFCTNQKPTIVFSGLFYPDNDFLGNRLQNLADGSAMLDLMTFSFAPMPTGWGVLFAWHSSSSRTCVPFVRSLATRMYQGYRAGDDLFRLIIACCENLAIRPSWWEGLADQDKQAITRIATGSADLFAPTAHDYLTNGAESIAGWDFTGVVSDMD